MDAKRLLYNCVYVVIMNRWGAETGHHYTMGVFTDLEAAKLVAEEEREHRGGKYEWVIEAWSMNKDRRDSPMGKTFFRVAKSEEMGCLTDEESSRLLRPNEATQEWYDHCAKLDVKRLREELTQERECVHKWMEIAAKLQNKIGVKDE